MAAPGFRLGNKRVYLPSHVISLCRPGKPQPPTFAKFKVPLKLNKLDMRDYLHNVYNVDVTSVRSQIMQSPIRRDDITRRLGRPQPTKFMMVELTKPFLWPDPPTEEEIEEKFHDKDDQRMNASRVAEYKKQILLRDKGLYPMKSQTPASAARKALRSQAERYRKGRAQWKSERDLDPKWSKGMES